MPYALFSNNDQISKAYNTEHEVWKKADEAGLVVDVASKEENPHPKRVLDADFCIKPCQADADHQGIQTWQNPMKNNPQTAGSIAIPRAGRQAAAAKS